MPATHVAAGSRLLQPHSILSSPVANNALQYNALQYNLQYAGPPTAICNATAGPPAVRGLPSGRRNEPRRWPGNASLRKRSTAAGSSSQNFSCAVEDARSGGTYACKAAATGCCNDIAAGVDQVRA